MADLTQRPPEQLVKQASDWWSTSIVDIEPGKIHFRGYPIQELIGRVSYPDMAWLLLRGELPTREQSALLEAAMVAGVDHGPHAPSIAISRMAVSCGLPVNGAMASAVNVLDDVHGGAGQQCMELMYAIDRLADGGTPQAEHVAAGIDAFVAEHGKILPGFGHRFHGIDPRAVKLMKMVDEAREQGFVSGRFAVMGRLIDQELTRRKGSPIPMNIDGATAAIYCELGFAPELGRGLFVLSRSIGILAHAWEQKQNNVRIKGPMPPSIPYTYTGPAERAVNR